MKPWAPILIFLLITGLILAAGCTGTLPAQKGQTPAPPASPATGLSPAKITPADLTDQVKEAVLYAKENGKEKAIAEFNDPNGSFVRNGVYIFTERYDGTALAEPFEQELVGTNIGNMTDRYGVPLVKNLQETARYGIGYVSYDYPNPQDKKTITPKLSVVADVDGSYYIGAGTYAGSGMVYPSIGIGPKSREYTVGNLTTFVKSAVSYAKENGKEKALIAFNDPKGQFADGELTLIAVDYNGTVLANSLTPDTANNRINLINYHDPDGVTTIREMRDLALQGGGYSYTVAAVTKDGRTGYAPKIDYAEPVDDTYWVFSGIIVPEYEQLREGNLTGITVRSHTRTELYDLVDRAVTYAKVNGKERTLAEINNPKGEFVNGDLFVWAEDFNGTLLADPYWKEGIGKNWMDYSDPYGSKTTVLNINAIRSGTGFTHAMFMDTARGRGTSVPKLLYAKAVDDTWWIGSGIYGVQKT
ncbi:cache domain-containing protein [Methanoregula sp.]|uniref:cache domain-containing protein n=1 Tax=Methanoregula sp. TaxID=2052170 RepID=UPI0026133EB2|nr:cache domain-containing protein [Methanoregula sp.]MDD5142835.1 cache domain-containing protein [Methanoregula sp.]